MNVLLLSPHFPPHWWQFARALAERGHRVLALGDVPAGRLGPELQGLLADYLFVPDLFDREEVLRAAALLVHRHGRIHRLDSLNEHWLGVEALLREDLNVPGLRPAELSRMRLKSGMYDCFTQAGIPTPETHRISTLTALEDFAGRVGFPLVLKPDLGVGAADTHRVETLQALRRHFEAGLDGRVAQPFIRGAIVTYDGLVTRNGRIVFALSEAYSAGVMDVVNEGLDVAFWTSRELEADLEALGRRVLEAFGVRERFFHLEFFRQPDGGLVALEVNLRPPGAFVTEMLNYSLDADVARLWARVLEGDELEALVLERRWYVGHAARHHHRRYRHSIAELRARFPERFLLHRELPSLFSRSMGDEMVLFRASELPALAEALDAARERLPSGS